MRLMTKQDRQNARASWIGERSTEKYKDIEILFYSKNYNDRTVYSLTIWRGSAGKPHINYLCRSEAQAQSYITQEKKYADNREQYYREHPKTNGKVQTESAKAAFMIKNILKREYPKVKFSVRSDNFANGNSVDISWTDGIPAKEIESFARQFESGTFDGMTDCYNYDNTAEHPQAKFVCCQRHLSEGIREKIKNELAVLVGINPNEDYMRPQGQFFVFNGEHVLDFEGLNNAVHRISYNFDFTKGFSGIRKRFHEGHEITNTFELY